MSVGSILGGIVALIKAIPILNSWFQQLMAKWMESQTQDTLDAISDAAAFAARASTQVERFEAAKRWQKALQRPRVLP
jgi:hypothetical protein